MASVDNLDGVLERFKQAGNEFVKGTQGLCRRCSPMMKT